MLNNQKHRDILAQAMLVSIVAITLLYCAIRIRYSVQSQGMVSGFGFLDRSTGWDMSFSVINYSINDSYARVLWVGLLNTLFSGLIGLVGASFIGGCVGIARLSKNYLLRTVGSLYVNLFRSVPLILQIIFWYQIIGHLPHPRQAVDIGGWVFLSNRGIYWPTLTIAEWALWVFALLVIVAAVVGLAKRSRFARIGLQRRFVLIGIVFVMGAVIAAGSLGQTTLFDIPRLAGLNIKGGSVLQPELCALVFGIWLYGGAYIGEVVRSGFMSVRKGQVEAARALGLKPLHIFSRVQLPLAFRAMLPSLSNQYILLMKATTLGIAIGFSEFFFVISTSINQSGQTLELLALLMLGFLAINLTIGIGMNTLNRRLALKGK